MVDLSGARCTSLTSENVRRFSYDEEEKMYMCVGLALMSTARWDRESGGGGGMVVDVKRVSDAWLMYRDECDRAWMDLMEKKEEENLFCADLYRWEKQGYKMGMCLCRISWLCVTTGLSVDYIKYKLSNYEQDLWSSMLDCFMGLNNVHWLSDHSVHNPVPVIPSSGGGGGGGEDETEEDSSGSLRVELLNWFKVAH